MKPRICICCGEPMLEQPNGLSRNPNVCTSCSSMLDGMEQTSVSGVPEPEANAFGLSELRQETADSRKRDADE